MCKCNPNIKTPYCGKGDCVWPKQEPTTEGPNIKNTYEKTILCTESHDPEIINRIKELQMTRTLHALLGLQSEVGELADQVKRHVFYGSTLDTTNIVEEMGDVMWYLALLSDVVGVSFEHIQRINTHKLRTRYGEKFDQSKAENRDLVKERKALEGDKPLVKNCNTCARYGKTCFSTTSCVVEDPETHFHIYQRWLPLGSGR